MNYDEQLPIDRLRALVRRWGNVRESLAQSLTLKELLEVDRAWCLSEWDFSPDKWTPGQIREAKRGRIPTWDENERPT
jgi:hypothetical protein